MLRFEGHALQRKTSSTIGSPNFSVLLLQIKGQFGSGGYKMRTAVVLLDVRKSVDMSGISEGSKGCEGCEVGDCSDISQHTIYWFVKQEHDIRELGGAIAKLKSTLAERKKRSKDQFVSPINLNEVHAPSEVA
ncbi:hypothetical protein DEO72_LG11g1424 [Vigna unguiculata]|uniref:Uncharacterized protein n=1 Tax=Vigna unguiculata TaxID=3917 RepID=A0A4D6NP30_VIGUN|nr:hypothetical protein DEO72_LG11g1424 [Vigna unguiculata]